MIGVCDGVGWCEEAASGARNLADAVGNRVIAQNRSYTIRQAVEACTGILCARKPFARPRPNTTHDSRP